MLEDRLAKCLRPVKCDHNYVLYEVFIVSDRASDILPGDRSGSEPAVDDSAASAAASSEEVASVIAELEQYRARLVDDFTTTAKKAKLPKSMTLAQLKKHPEILKIDAALAQLRGETPPDDAA